MKNHQAKPFSLFILMLTLTSLLSVLFIPTSTPVRAFTGGTVRLRQEVALAASVSSSFAPATVSELIAAITQANSNNADDVIDLGGQTFTLTVVNNNTSTEANGLPIIDSDNGHKLLIQNGRIERSTAGGTPNFRIFESKSGATVTISRLTITNGRAPDGGNESPGIDGGGIRNAGNLTLTAVTLSGNRSGNGGTGFGFNGGNGGVGGGIFNAEGATLIISNSTISGNRTGDGANSHTRDGGAGGAGGGIYNSPMSTLTINNSTIIGNQTGNGGSPGGGPGSGGGIYNAGTTTLTISNCTITGNSSGNGGGIDVAGSTSPIVRSSIIAGNTAQNGPDVKGTFTSQGYNLVGNTSDSNGFTQMTDQTGTQASPLNPRLELDAMNKPLLKDNGGPTPTIALLCGSPAIDKGNNFTSATTDQRGAGFARIFDNSTANASDSSDIGAFEVQTTCNPPVAQCHNVTISASANCTASASINNNSFDPDAGDTITVSQSPAGPYAKGTTTVTLTVTDNHGATATCQATVTVLDSTAPAIACNNIAAQSVNTDASCSALVPDVTGLVRAQSNDNCTAQASLSITQSPTSGSTVNGTGSHPITVTVKDADNNETTCVVAFTLNDTTAPTINCPANITKSTDPNQCAALVSFAPTANDNCSGVGTPTCTPPSGSSFPKGTTTVTCTVKDAANNQSAPCSFTVTINDTQAPSITCSLNISAPAATGQCGAAVSYNTPIVSDNCPGVGAPLCAPPSGSTFPKGTTTVTCTVKDAANNQSACSFTVTVVDTQAPTITCPANIITNTVNAGDASVAVTFAAPTAADNCSGVSVACVPPSGSMFPRGVTTVNCTATDASNNQANCSFTVRVFDYVIVDDSNGKIMRFDSVTGDYDFFDCRKNKSLSGRGTVTINACKTELRDSKPDRTVTVLANPCTRSGNTTVINGGATHTLNDLNLSNNRVSCP
jgi:hypothetical protein